MPRCSTALTCKITFCRHLTTAMTECTVLTRTNKAAGALLDLYKGRIARGSMRYLSGSRNMHSEERDGCAWPRERDTPAVNLLSHSFVAAKEPADAHHTLLPCLLLRLDGVCIVHYKHCQPAANAPVLRPLHVITFCQAPRMLARERWV